VKYYFRTGSLPDSRRDKRRRCACPFARSGPLHRKARLSAILGGGASQYARHCERGNLSGHRPHCREHFDDPSGLGRDHAPQSLSTRRRRTIRNVGVTVSRAGRPWPRPCARHRPGTMRFLRRNSNGTAEEFQRLEELRSFFRSLTGQRVRAAPGAGPVPIWLLVRAVSVRTRRGTRIALRLSRPFARQHPAWSRTLSTEFSPFGGP
jgi:hypothetical protein